MRVGATGLGKTEMVAGIKRLEPVENGYIVMEMHVLESKLEAGPPVLADSKKI